MGFQRDRPATRAAPNHVPEWRPPAGTSVDEVRSIPLPSTLCGPCIAVPTGAVVIVVSLEVMQQRVAAKPTQWCTESERMALIDGERAEVLMAALSESLECHGCRLAESAHLGEAAYLLLREIECGGAVVKVLATGEALSSVEIHYVGLCCEPNCGRGDIHVHWHGERAPFLSVNWWVA